jgi:hypothetical protein
VAETIKKRRFGSSLERFKQKKEQESITKIAGEKSEADFKAYGVHCKKKVKVRGFNHHQNKLLQEQKEAKEKERKESRLENYLDKNIAILTEPKD